MKGAKFNLTYNELPEVLIEVVNYIIETYDLIPDEEEEQFKRMIDTAVKLIMLQPKVKKGLVRLWGKIKSVLTCSCTKKQKTKN